jgi:ATPase family associated with various cellular activities (AAA)
MNSLTSLPWLQAIPALAAVALIIPFWGQIKAFVSRIINLLIVNVSVTSTASIALLYYLKEHGKQLPTNVRKYSSGHVYVKKYNDTRIVLFEGVRDLTNQLYWIDRAILGITDKHGKDKETGLEMDLAISVRYIRGTINFEQLLVKATQWYESRQRWEIKWPRFRIQRWIGEGRSRTSNGSPGFPPAISSSKSSGLADDDFKYTRLINYQFEDLGYSSRSFFYIFDQKTRKVYEDVEKWLKSKDWYQDRGLLWRRGCLLSSKPGQGKSALIRKIGQALDLPVFVFELSTMSDPEFLKYWCETVCSNPCIVVMEDIDTIWNKRKPLNENSLLSFECLLNCISGVEPAEGIYLFITTNRLDYLDEALGIPNAKGLSTRPGRLDLTLELDDLTIEGKKEIAQHFLADYPDQIEKILAETNGMTPAQFSDICSQKALEFYWNKSENQKS